MFIQGKIMNVTKTVIRIMSLKQDSIGIKNTVLVFG